MGARLSDLVVKIPATKRRALCRLIEGEIRCLDTSYTHFHDGRIHDIEVIRDRRMYAWLLEQLGGPKLPSNTYVPTHLRSNS
jgi:hypothetical protein